MTGRDLAERLAAEHHRWLAMARLNSYTEHDAEDALQRALEIVLTKLPADTSEEDGRRWFNVVLRHECWNLGKRSVRDGIDLNYEIPDPRSDLSTRAELTDVLNAIREKLTPLQQRTLLQFLAGFSYNEIGAIEGRKWNSVNKSIVRARANLAKAMA